MYVLNTADCVLGEARPASAFFWEERERAREFMLMLVFFSVDAISMFGDSLKASFGFCLSWSDVCAGWLSGVSSCLVQKMEPSKELRYKESLCANSLGSTVATSWLMVLLTTLL